VYFAGIDIAKKRHEVCVLDQQGNQVFAMPVNNDSASAKKLLSVIHNKLGEDTENIAFCMEATGHYWLAMYHFLDKAGYKVHVINPIQSDAVRDLYIRKSKTDRKDAFILADLLRMNQTKETALGSEVMLKLQTLSRTRFAFVDQVSALKQRVLGILDRIFPEYPDFFSDVFIKTSRELLKSYTTPEDIAAADLDELTDFLAAHSRGRIKADRAAAIQKYARGTFGIGLAVDAFALELRLIMDQIEFIETQISALEDAIQLVMQQLKEETGHHNDAYNHVVETIPGVGPVLAAAIIGELGDITRFSSAKKLVAYAGIDATISQSGAFRGSMNHMSKRGSSYLRRAIWLAANGARRFSPELSSFYEAKRAEGKHFKVATGAVARRLLHIIHAVWSQDRPFDAAYRWHPSGQVAD